MTHKKKLKINSKFKKGQLVVYDFWGIFQCISKIEDIKVKLNQVLYFVNGKWLVDSDLKVATPEEIAKQIAYILK